MMMIMSKGDGVLIVRREVSSQMMCYRTRSRKKPEEESHELLCQARCDNRGQAQPIK